VILSAFSLTSLQSCPRKFLLEADLSPIRIRPKALFDKTLRAALVVLSHGTLAKDCAADARATFLEACANPGMDLPRGSDSYRIALDYCAMLDTILRSAAKWKLPPLAPSPPVRLSGAADWQPEAFLSPDGTLHRFITVDGWSDADLSRELHGWGVVGDLCILNLPLTIHVVDIGRMRNGRRASPWARAWRHPTMPNLRMRFAKKDGGDFKGWTAYYLADHRDESPEDWVAQMEKEGAAQGAVRALRVEQPDAATLADTLGQLRVEAARASVLLSERASTPWAALPMSRSSCDLPFPCIWQHACYQPATPPQNTGLYRYIENATVAKK
jgi:hypothetical protein